MEASTTHEIDEYHQNIEDESNKFQTLLKESDAKECKCTGVNLKTCFVSTINIKESLSVNHFRLIRPLTHSTL